MLATLTYDPPATIAAYDERRRVHCDALVLKEQLDRLCRALHPATPQNPRATRKLAADLSRDLQALRGRL